MIRDILIPLLTARFPDRFTTAPPGVEPCATFPAIHHEVGDVEIHDDGDEITLVAGHFTHGHFSNYNEIPLEEKEKEIAEDVVDFLRRLFADQVVLWGSHEGGGGWRVMDHDEDDSSAPQEQTVVPVGTKGNGSTQQREFVWSGPRQN